MAYHDLELIAPLPQIGSTSTSYRHKRFDFMGQRVATVLEAENERMF